MQKYEKDCGKMLEEAREGRGQARREERKSAWTQIHL